ncbi:hypothetical protein ACFW2V_12425 [Streptomyces sp. NPDC058947]|uniref:hypothetical protein n=1 Tax=Streptomyces sp. NPDC058947 TaxID=3346675 RepID=UPI0036D10215
MTDEMVNHRFPPPRPEILAQIPEELHKLFGVQADPEPEGVDDEIDYFYEVKRPDGSPFNALIYGEYNLAGGLPVAFVVGDVIELDDVPVRVTSYSQESADRTLSVRDHRYWRVMVRPLEEGRHG